ncbi:MAG: GntR family transcriptional regulator [Clostridia bacterium]|nr:MAG: GntR family transcriptional regulator [Clostridia bacterium]
MPFDLTRPIYLQIVDNICRRVARGELPPGARLPSLRDPALELEVNPNTVQHAYQELERRGLTFTRRGEGTFLSEDPQLVDRLRQELAGRAAERYLAEMGEAGFSPAEALAALQERVKIAERGV